MRLSRLTAYLSAALIATPALAGSPAATFKGAEGVTHGTVAVTDAPKGVLLRLELTGLPPGWHGIHFHAKGDCGDAKFLNSGAHVPGAHDHGADMPKSVHGLLNPEANDSGDLPNIYVAADGTAKVELFSTLVSLKGSDGRPALKDADGSAIVIHAAPDDHMTQPIGGAGARIACAVIE